jgi:hypothetical protein
LTGKVLSSTRTTWPLAKPSPTNTAMLSTPGTGWRAFQAAEAAAVGITNDEGWLVTDREPVHRTWCTRRFGGSCTTPECRPSDFMISGIPMGVCSSRTGSR